MKRESKGTIAVVDDERAVLESLVDLLESAGYVARVFSSAQEFLDSEALRSIACLISDVRMPGMDGWELQSLVCEQRPHLPIILVTAHEEAERQAHLLRPHGGAQLLFKKPFDGQQLLAAIKASIEVNSGEG